MKKIIAKKVLDETHLPERTPRKLKFPETKRSHPRLSSTASEGRRAMGHRSVSHSRKSRVCLTRRSRAFSSIGGTHRPFFKNTPPPCLFCGSDEYRMSQELKERCPMRPERDATVYLVNLPAATRHVFAQKREIE